MVAREGKFIYYSVYAWDMYKHGTAAQAPVSNTTLVHAILTKLNGSQAT